MSKYNIFTTKAGFDPNQTRDEDGKWSTKPGPLKDRPCFKEWFEGSKATKPNGEPKTFYHGTTHEFNEFEKGRGNIENDFGIGFYFSSSLDDVESNYDEVGPDLTNRIEQRIDQLENEYNEGGGMSRDDARSQAEKELVGGENRTISVYLSVKNPVVIGAPAFHADEKETIFTYDSGFDFETGEDMGETGTLINVMDGFLRAQQGYDETKWTEVQGDVYNAALDYGGLSASDLVEIMRKSEGLAWAMNDEGRLATNEIIRQTFENAGFDGIIDNTVWEKFGQVRKVGRPMPGIYEDTQHIIAFEPGSIKRTDARSFCHETDIRKSVLVNGKEVKAGFKPDQARDRSGKWTDKFAGMRKFEDSIKDNDFETAGVYDKDGNEKFAKEGGKSQVDFLESDMRQIDIGDILTHNHPEPISLSYADVEFLLKTRVSKIRAIIKDGTVFEMEYFGDIDKVKEDIGMWPIQALSTIYQNVKSEVWAESDNRADVLNGKLANSVLNDWDHQNELNKIYKSEPHRVWEKFSKTEFGKYFKYRKYEN